MRVKTGTVRRAAHKKVLKAAKGFWMTRHKRYKVAHEAVMHAGDYAFAGRRLKKRDLRQVWIVRINAALKPFDIRYSAFIKMLKNRNIAIDRKILADLAVNNPDAFKAVVESAK
ncbi:MAG TPA: 50S ribosomal protein L20 [Candidatus Woesebacteria bacterium]|nr:50S ribosomal protein L20 [Candidatus Woesebacteria bacterium]HOG37757.1 50S ribosomal protein L20 [Candidatus Woesebacteria bacterium]